MEPGAPRASDRSSSSDPDDSMNDRVDFVPPGIETGEPQAFPPIGVGTASVVVRLIERAEATPRRLAYTWLADGETEAASLTWGELRSRAEGVARDLHAMGLATGDRALLLFPPGLEFLIGFFGCLLGGVVAVPAYPPRSLRRPEREGERLAGVAADAAPRAVLTTAEIAAAGPSLAAGVPALRDLPWIALSETQGGVASSPQSLPEIDPSATAFLQYTSGSTSEPKGVIVSHANLAANLAMIATAFDQDESSIVVGWLPLYHDMGLIGNVLQPLWSGGRCILMAPVAFLQRPARWLEAIARYRATTSGGPDFAYALAARKVSEEEAARLDLSSWRVAFSGAEPVRAETLVAFARRFAPSGFRQEAFYPCYGLAEATLFVAGPTLGRPPRVAAFDAEGLEANEARPAAEGARNARRLVSCGASWGDQKLAIVEAEVGDDRQTASLGRHCAEGRIGEIWVSGPSIAAGYRNRPELSTATFGARIAGSTDRYLRTGDLGFVVAGELYVTGRLKDLIILRGRNHYPQDLERTAEGAHEDLIAGGSAAFSIAEGEETEELLILVAEVSRHARATAEAIGDSVRAAIAERQEVQVADVRLLAPGALPKTTSGKVRRGAARAAYLAGTLGEAVRRADTSRHEAAGGSGAERPTLEALSAVAARILRLPAERFDPARPLSAQGLDSLSAVELSVAARALGVDLPLSELLDGGSLADLLAGASAARGSSGPRAGSAAGATVLPLGLEQEALFAAERLAPGAYTIAVAALAEGLDAEALAAAAERAVARHPALGTVFSEAGGERSAAIQTFASPRIDLIREQHVEGDGDLSDRLGALLFEPFDLATGPLVRLALLERPGGETAIGFAVHHLVADFASLALFVEDLTALYAAEVSCRLARLAPPAEISLADLLAWRAERLVELPTGEGSVFSARRAALTGVEDLDLPTDRPRPAVRSFRGLLRAQPLSPEVEIGLDRLARSTGSTPFALLVALFSAYLHRITGQSRFAIAAPTSGRQHAGLERLIGYLVQPAAIPVEIDGDPSFAVHAMRIRGASAAAVASAAEAPFSRLAEALRPRRDPSRPPLAQVAATFERAGELAAFALGIEGAHVDLAGQTVRALALPERRVPFEWALHAARSNGTHGSSLHLALEANADLFEAKTIERALARLERLVESAIARPEAPLSGLSLLSAAERAELIDEGGAGVSGAKGGPLQLIPEAVAARVAADPTAVAIVEAGRVLNYGDLWNRALALGGDLAARGVGAERFVALLAGRSAAAVIGQLAALLAGGAYLPLDPAHPDERLAFEIADSGAAIVLASREMLERARRIFSCPVLDLEAPGGRPLTRPANVAPEQAAYAIYTSGSTGRPKAVVVPHGALANLFAWHLATYRLTPSDRTPLLAGPAFDAAVWETWPPLAAGAALVAPEAGMRTDPERLPAWLERVEATVAFLSTPIAEACLAGTWALAKREPADSRPGRGLRVILTGGDRLRSNPPAGLPFALVNHYGPTENAVVATAGEVRAGDPREEEGAPSIGRPIDGVRAYVLDRAFDRNRQLAPFGEAGELALGGRGLARGYHRRPDLTAERFIPDPFSGEPGARLYRTGDRVRWKVDGNGSRVLDFLGRIDAQVKVRGQRIELGEIEAAILAAPGVSGAAAAVFGTGERARLAAYVVPTERAFDVERLKSALAARLPEAMIPSAFVELSAIPLTPNGKIDRRRLPEPSFGTGGEAYEPPKNATEEIVAGIFAEVLGTSRPIGRHEDLLGLGLHSLSAARAAARVGRAFERELPLVALFERPTVSGLAERLAEKLAKRLTEGDAGGEPLPRVRSGVRGQRSPLTFPQRRLWFLERLHPGRATYHVAGAVELRGKRNEGALEKTLIALVERHEALRTAIPNEEGEPYQIASAVSGALLPRVDLSALGPEAAESERLARELARRPFDLAAGPLVRFASLMFGPTRAQLVSVFHHLIADGASLDLFWGEFEAAYGAFCRGAAPNLPPAEIQLADVARWQTQHLTASRVREPLAYFRDRLADLEPLDLPADRARGARRTGAGRTLSARFGGGLGERLAARARSFGATPFMLLGAALHALLARLSGRAKTAIGTPVANRNAPELAGVFGFLANTLVLDLETGDDPTAPELLERMRAGALAAYAREELPFELLVEEIAPRRDLAQNPLFDVLLSLEPPLAPRRAGALELLPRRLDSGTAKLDLALAVVPAAAGFEIWAEYDTERFDGATIERWLAAWERSIEAIASGTPVRLSELPLLTDAERAQILAASDGGAAVPTPGLALLHARFFALAAERPGALAVVGAEERLTYGQLAARAQGFADVLRARGVAPEERVGVLLSRGPDLVASLLGVLAAGGAYVPLDPAYPEERLRFLLDDSGARICLVERGLAHLVPAEVALPIEDLIDHRETGRDLARVARPEPRHLAYLIYTSGSTGRPKSVAIDHGTAAGFISWSLSAFPADELQAVLFATSVCFDLSVFELFATLSSGGALVLADNALDLAVAAARHPVTLINTVPSALAELVRSEGLPASILAVNLAGEALPGTLVERIFASSPSVRRVNNLYGPSEDTTYSTWQEIRRGEEGPPPPIGQPLPGTSGYVVGRFGELLPAGVPGELRLAGAGLARGYLGRPDLTAERFVPDPFSGVPGARLYTTGDRSRLDLRDPHFGRPTLHYLGRIDNQVKVRGFRVELGEVEAALLAVPGVREAAVAVVGEGGDRRLAGFVAGEAETAAILAELKGRLPGYLVPGTLARLDTLPRLPNGKLDRKALGRLAAEEPGGAEYVAPRNRIEVALAEIFAEVLGREKVGVHDDFFALGGHSLLAARAAARVARRLGRELPVADLFEAPTVAGLGVRLAEGGAQAGSPVASLPLVACGRPKEGLPLAFAQERIWFLDQLAPGRPTYHLAGEVEIAGALDGAAPARLAAALARVVARHEVLRTAIRDGSAGPRQIARPVGSSIPPLPFADLRAVPAERRKNEGARLVQALGTLPLDLSRGVVLRTLLVGERPDEFRLALSLHHAAADGGSLGIFAAELAETWSASVEARAGRLPELPIQFADFAVWQREALDPERLETLLATWRERLSGLPLLDLPTDRDRPEARSGRGDVASRSISAAVVAGLDEAARRSSASRFQALSAAAFALLARLTGEPRIPLGTPVEIRPRVEVERLIGMFGNTLVLDVNLGDDPAAEALLARARDAVRFALAHRDLPFEVLVEDLSPRRDTARSPLFPVLFVLEEPLSPWQVGGVTFSPRRVDVGTARFDLTLDATPTPDGGLAISAEYDSDLFDRSTIDRWLAAYDRLLSFVSALSLGSGSPLSSVPVFRAEEEAELRLRRALRPSFLPARDAVDGGASESIGGDEIEATVAALFAEVLGRERVAVREDFFALGGGSLLAARLLARVREVFGARAATLPLARFFAAPTPAGLARELRANERRGGSPPTRRTRDPEGEPLSFAVERMEFLERLEPGTAAYHLPFVLGIRGGEPDRLAPRFAAALGAILSRHAPLRTRFVEVETLVGNSWITDVRGWEIPWSSRLLRMPRVDLRAVSNARASEARRIETAAARRPFAIGREPLLRALWLALAPREARLAATIHHLAADGASLALFARELGVLMEVAEAAEAGRPSPLPELPIAYADFAAWQREELARGALEPAFDLARAELAGAPERLDLPTDFPVDGMDRLRAGSRGGEVPVALSAALSTRLFARARSFGATPFQWTLAALASLLARVAGQDDLVIGVPVAGRTREEIEPLIGLFVNTVPVRLRTDGDPSFADLVLRARGAALSALSRGDLPLERLIEELGAATARRDGRPPLFSVLFTYQDRPLAPPNIPGLAIEIEELSTATAKLDLALALREVEGILVGRFEYDANLFARASVERWARSFVELLEAAVDDPSLPLSEIDRRLAPEPERRRPVAPHEPDSGAPSYEPPSGPIETKVAEIFGEVLGSVDAVGERQPIGAHDGFFALGGHSLLAARVLSAVRRRFGLALPLKALFERPTVRELAERIAAGVSAVSSPAKAVAASPPIVPLPSRAERPLSLAQERLWFLDRMGAGAAYNLPVALRLTGPLEPPRLAAAIAEVARRHEGLRASFPEREGRPRLAIAPPGLMALPAIDLASLDATPRAAEVRRLARDRARLPFDLAVGPLFRALLLRLASHPATNGGDHVLLFEHHHAVSDGASIGLLVAEVGEALAALSAGRAAALPALSIQVADYAAWQRRRWADALVGREASGETAGRVEGEETSRQIQFWRHELAQVPTVLDLPTDRTRPPVLSTRGLAVPLVWGLGLAERIEALARAQGTTAFAVLAAGFGALLARWTVASGRAPLLLGTPVSGRDRPEIEPLIGFFANVVPLRIDRVGLSGAEGSFADLLGRVRNRALDALAHAEMPFERLVEVVARDRDPSRPPLVQAALNWQAESPLRGARFGDLSLTVLADLEELDGSTIDAKFELLLSIERTPDGMAGRLEIAADLFDRTTAWRWVDQLGRLLAAAVDDPNGAPWGDLPMLGPGERHQVLVEWRAGHDPAEVSPWTERVAAWAERAPDRPAAFFGDAVLTFGALVSRSRALARRFRALDLRPEDRVAIALDRSFEALIAIHAILSVGCAYVPLDAGYPAERIAFVLADSACRALVAPREAGRSDERAWAFRIAARWAERLPTLTMPVVLLNDARIERVAAPGTDFENDVGDERKVPTAPAFDPARLAYVTYTSGSTGRPKGVAVSHGALEAYIASQTEVLGLGPDDRMPQFSSLGFDGSVEEIFAPLAAGGALSIRGTEVPGARELLRQFEERRVSVVFLSTAYWSQICAAIAAEDLRCPASLREVRFGGEAGHGDSVRDLLAREPALRLVNVYGPTETTVIAAGWPIPRTSDVPARLPIGRGMPHIRVAVVDAHFRPVPRGVVGELLLGGPSLARGYLDRPDLTADRFVPDPSTAEGDRGARLYRTGDLVRHLPGGDLEFLGRVEGPGGQVKLRGFRIELGEIEAALMTHPAVAAAVAGVERSDRFADRLVAWVAAPSAAPSPEDLLAHLAPRLPVQMIPAAIAVLPALPIAPGGKVDRRALPAFGAPEARTLEARSLEAPPAGGLEARLLGLWTELFGAAGLDDNFFDLGASSVSLVRFHSRVQVEIGREIPLVTLFQHPTLRRLAASLSETGGAEVEARQVEQLSAARLRSVERREGLAELERRRARVRRRI